MKEKVEKEKIDKLLHLYSKSIKKISTNDDIKQRFRNEKALNYILSKDKTKKSRLNQIGKIINNINNLFCRIQKFKLLKLSYIIPIFMLIIAIPILYFNSDSIFNNNEGKLNTISQSLINFKIVNTIFDEDFSNNNEFENKNPYLNFSELENINTILDE